MAMKTKADVQARAREHARFGVEKHPYMRSSNSWQAIAYWAAYTEQLGEIKKERDAAKAFFDQGTETERISSDQPALSNTPKGIDVKKIVKVRANLKSSGLMMQPIPPEAMPQTGMIGWPIAAKEHAAKLKTDLSTELHAKRASRLLASLQRLYARHEAKSRTLGDFPISTQPHPDGDVTLGMLLSGR